MYCNARLVKLLLSCYELYPRVTIWMYPLSTPEFVSGLPERTDISSSVHTAADPSHTLWLWIHYFGMPGLYSVTLLLVKDWEALKHVSIAEYNLVFLSKRNSSSTVSMCQMAAQKSKPSFFLLLLKLLFLMLPTDEYSPFLTVHSEDEWSYVLVCTVRLSFFSFLFV